VTAVDVSRRAVLTARINARLNGVRVRALRGDLLAPVGDERFDLIVSNPPYVPAEDDALPTRGPQRAWDAGTDGRALLDRLCAAAPAHLRPGGALLLVHSSVCGLDPTVEQLEAAGLRVDVLDRRRGAFGPLLAARAPLLEARGLLAPGQREEDMLVVRAAA
jgi:release factor glutamine methyltransferase